MRPNVKYEMDSFVKWFIYILLAVAVGSALASCNPVRQVLSDPKKKEIVGREWEKTNPCITDSVTNIILGKDSIIIDSFETVYNRLDTVNNTQTKEILKYITKTIARVDTIKKVLEDNRRLQIAKDSINYYHGVRDLLTENVKSEKSKSRKWFWLFIGVCSLNAIWIFFKLRKSFVSVIAGK